MKFERRKVATALAYALGGSALIVDTTALAATSYTVTGTGIPRASVEGALPVQTITREDIEKSGVRSVEELLATISAISSQGATQLPTGAAQSTFGFSGASLRGLGSSRTLVLINGRRTSPFSSPLGTGGVNVNNIPLSGIERVEVLKDGASAVYGADAIAGVINFIMANNYQGAEANMYASTPTRSGGGQTYQPSAVMGFGDYDKDRYNLTITAQYSNSSLLFARDRSFAKTSILPPYYVGAATGAANIEGGWNPGTGSAANGTWVPGTPIQPGFASGGPSGGYGNPLAATGKCGTISMFLDPNPTNKGSPFCTFDSGPFVNLSPGVINTGLTGNFRFKLNDSIELFGNALWSESTVTQQIQTSPMRRSFSVTDEAFLTKGIDPVLLINPSNPNYAIAANFLATVPGGSAIIGKPLAITARVMDFGPRTQEDTSLQNLFTVGARGVLWKQDWEIAYTYSKNKIDGSTTAGYFSQTEFSKIVQTSNDWNPWSSNQTDSFKSKLPAAAYNGATLLSKADSNTIDAKISGDVMQLPAGPLQYAAGYQWADGTFNVNPSEAMLSGDIAGLGGAIKPLNQSRTLNAVYGEFNIPIIKSLEANLQGRYDDYSDVGHKFTYKGSLRFQPAKPYLLRASYNTGFRPPTLNDLWYPQVLGSTAQLTDPAFPNDKGVQYNSYSGGNPLLKPETSKQWQVGGVWSPTDNFNFGAEYFNLKLKNILATPSAQEVISNFRAGDPAYQNLVVLVPGTNQVDLLYQVTANSGTAKVAGWDFEGSWHEKFSFGNINVTYYGTYMDKFDQTSPGGVLNHKVGTVVTPNGDPVLDADTAGGVILRYKHQLQATWSDGPWAVTATQNWYNGYRGGDGNDGQALYVSNQQLYDLRIAYTGIKNVSLAVGARNIFDKNPPIYVGVANEFQCCYDISLYDGAARVVYGTIGVKFN